MNQGVHDIFCALKLKGVVVSAVWLTQCLVYLDSVGYIRSGSSFQDKIDAVLSVFINQDLYQTAEETDLLPEGMSSLHMVRLFPTSSRVLQIDEVVDVGGSSQKQETLPEDALESDGAPAAHASKLPPGRHLLKAFVTDGVQQVVALDLGGVLSAAYLQHTARLQQHRHGQGAVPSICTFFAGAKIVVHNVLLRRGALVLTKETVQFLGGYVSRLQDQNTGGAQMEIQTTPQPAPITANITGSSGSVETFRADALPLATAAPVTASAAAATLRQAAYSAVGAEAALVGPFPDRGQSATVSPMKEASRAPPAAVSHGDFRVSSVATAVQHTTAAPVAGGSRTEEQSLSSTRFVESHVGQSTARVPVLNETQPAATVPAIIASKTVVVDVAVIDSVPSPSRQQGPPSDTHISVLALAVPSHRSASGPALVAASVSAAHHHNNHSHDHNQEDHDFSFYDVPFTNDGPMLTCDLTISQDDCNDPGSGAVAGADTEHHPAVHAAGEQSHTDEMDVVDGSGLDFATQLLPSRGSRLPADSPGHDRITAPHMLPENPGEHTPRQAADFSSKPALHYWDQIPSSGDQSGEGMEGSAMFRVRAITNRILRLKTSAPDGAGASSDRSSGCGKREFNIAVEMDDGHNLLACRVSNDLAEHFLNMTAEDHHVLSAQASKADAKVFQKGLVARFQHFHGLFWACRCPQEGGGGGQGISVVLIDFAQEDVQGLCAQMLHR